MPNNVSVIILTHNSQDTLAETLENLAWADEIIIVDQSSTDDTLAIAKKFQSRVVTENSPDFSVRRNIGADKATNPWLLYIDADEIVPPKLKQEIIKITQDHQSGAYTMTRTNYFLGTKMYPDTVTRLFHKNTLVRWEGAVHESPTVTGELTHTASPLVHHTHRSISTMLAKTNAWSAMQAQLLLAAKHPPVKVWRIFRIAATEIIQQFFVKKVGRYGKAGWIEGMFQVIDKIIVYIKLWELQQS
ncbi:hypothetical protein A3B57_01770 [Microgenomates group bacterium RIFCSPLOWO2_01_FULL_47_10]|nr:MAG: hypothetical protein A3B57_01770 [Microgenomates group bacterium RIFCSPLOWO2_01_FULL_47_10]